MLTREENQLLTRVGPEAPMGQMLRRYWIPACLSEEVPEPDCDPVRVKLLGEELVAFRDSNGGIGLLGEHCPHRGPSLALGRNEGCGLRCLYHGWKMDVHGNVVDMPSEPADGEFRHKIKHVSYPTHEQGDVVWAYMGPREHTPAFPNFAWTGVPRSHREVVKVHEAANWAQALEGAIDSSHASVLHQGLLLSTGPAFVRPSRDTDPRLEVEDTPYGFRYAAIRTPIEHPDTQKYVRVTLFAAPFHCFVPPKGYSSMHIFVPMDDENTWFFGVNFSHAHPIDPADSRERRGAVKGVDIDANYRKLRTRENNYLQDRAAMRAGRSFTGIRGIPAQDMAMQETMGAIYDRTTEHLGSSDIAIIRFRRRMLDAVRAFSRGAPPPGLDESIPYHRLQSDERVVPIDLPWQAVGAFAGEYAPDLAAELVAPG